MLSSKYVVYDSKKLILIKEQKASWLLISLGIKVPLSNIPLLGDIFFEGYKMNEILNNLY